MPEPRIVVCRKPDDVRVIGLHFREARPCAGCNGLLSYETIRLPEARSRISDQNCPRCSVFMAAIEALSPQKRFDGDLLIDLDMSDLAEPRRRNVSPHDKRFWQRLPLASQRLLVREFRDSKDVRHYDKVLAFFVELGQ